jgi:hypothetical protein
MSGNYQLKSTSTGKTLEAGTSTDNCQTFTAPEGFAVVGFMGQVRGLSHETHNRKALRGSKCLAIIS